MITFKGQKTEQEIGSHILERSFIIILAVIIVPLITISITYKVQSTQHYEQIVSEYPTVQTDLDEVYDYLISLDNTYICIGEEYLNDTNDTINKRESNYVLNTDAGQNLTGTGYYKIVKDGSAVGFYRYENIHGIYGIVRGGDALDGMKIAKTEPLGGEWYYFEMR